MNKYILCFCVLLTACAHTEFTALQGKTGETVRAQKGDPSLIIHENGHEMWTYRIGECRQLIFFDEEGRVTDWHESKTCNTPE